MVARRGGPLPSPEPCQRLRVRRVASWEPKARFCGSACARRAQEGAVQATVLQVTVDAVPPTGTVAINAGASFTRIPTVTLTLSATDASGLADMCISNVPSCSTWVPFARTRSWSLPAGDGAKSVYARFRDRVGNAPTSAAQDQIVLDSAAPTNPSTLTSSSHGVETWSRDRTVQVHWAGATDGGSGVSGYSLRWDRVATTLPDVHTDTTGVTATSPALADGRNHFVHLRTVDRAGNWTGGAVHLGPFFIDGTPPYTGTLAAAPGPARISLSWTGFSDPTSGLAVERHLQLVFSTSAYPAARCTNGTPLFVGTARQFVHQNLVSGTRHYYRLCAFDKAGNVSTAPPGPPSSSRRRARGCRRSPCCRACGMSYPAVAATGHNRLAAGGLLRFHPGVAEANPSRAAATEDRRPRLLGLPCFRDLGVAKRNVWVAD